MCQLLGLDDTVLLLSESPSSLLPLGDAGTPGLDLGGRLPQGSVAPLLPSPLALLWSPDRELTIMPLEA